MDKMIENGDFLTEERGGDKTCIVRGIPQSSLKNPDWRAFRAGRQNGVVCATTHFGAKTANQTGFWGLPTFMSCARRRYAFLLSKPYAFITVSCDRFTRNPRRRVNRNGAILAVT
jgi:hypothetical protein